MRALPFWFGSLLFLGWMVSVASFRLGMTLFADFVIRMPILTRVAIALTGSFLLVMATCFVAFVALLLARKKRVGWWMSLAVCATCNLLSLAWAMPVTALINDAINDNPVPFLPNASMILELVGSFFGSFSKMDFTDPTTIPFYSPFTTSGLTLLLFIALIIKRRIWLNPEV